MDLSYDAVIILGAGIVKKAEEFVTTTYADSDSFGMLGGHMRVLAALELHKKQLAPTFIFTTGISAKSIALYGKDIPTEAAIYSQEFRSLVHECSLAEPTILLEDQSANTLQNMQQCLAIISAHGWHTVAVVSSDYHIARVEALISLLAGAATPNVAITYLSAEEIVRQALPGVYDQQIRQAYASDAANIRLKNEALGLRAIQSDSYIPTEFQLSPRP
jgi:uncharacterized SAM-binding protein YcdF (DUF218 family)